MTSAPSLPAISGVRSMDPLSTTTTSSQHRRLSIALAMFRSSSTAMMVAEIFILMRPGHRSNRKGKNEDDQSQPPELHAAAVQFRRIVNPRMFQPEKEEQNRPDQPARRE